MQAIYATPTMSNDPLNRYIFGGTASTEFVTISSDFADYIVVPTVQDAHVYYLESDGLLHQASTADLQDRWHLYIGENTEGEFALSKDGDILYR